MCFGFWAEETSPLPKVHCQLFGAFVDVSVKVTISSAALAVNEATGGSLTRIVWDVELEPPAFDAVRTTW